MVYLNLALILTLALACISAHIRVYRNIQIKPQLPPERLITEIEIAAKSIGYWEKRGLKSNDPQEKIQCIDGLMNAQKKLIALTGDYIPDEAKEILDTKPKLQPLPAGVVSINSAKRPK